MVVKMTKWNAEQQITTLRYSAYMTLWAAAMFTTVLIKNIAETLNWGYQGGLAVMLLLCGVFFLFYSIRWTRKYKIYSSGWHEMLGLYSDEFARDTNHKANSFSLYLLLLLLVPGFLLGDIASRTESLSLWLNLSNYSLLLLVIGALTWSLSVLYRLREGEGG